MNMIKQWCIGLCLSICGCLPLMASSIYHPSLQPYTISATKSMDNASECSHNPYTLDELLRDDGTKWDYSRLFTIELSTKIRIDEQLTNKNILEQFIINELCIDKSSYHIPMCAEIRINHSYSQIIDPIGPAYYYMVAEITQSRFFERDFIISHHEATRIVHVIPKRLRSTKPVLNPNRVLEFDKFPGVFSEISDGDINGNIWFYDQGLRLLAFQNLHSFYLNPPTNIGMTDINIIEMGHKYIDSEGIYLSIALKKLWIHSVEKRAVMYSNIRCTLFKTACSYIPETPRGYEYHFRIGNGDNFRNHEEDIIRHVSNPLNMVLNWTKMSTTIPLTAQVVTIRFDHVDKDDVFYLVQYDKHFARTMSCTSYYVREEPQTVLVRVSGYRVDPVNLPNKKLKNIELVFNQSNCTYYASEHIYVTCLINDVYIGEPTFSWYVSEDGHRYRMIGAESYNNKFVFRMGTVKNGNKIRAIVNYHGDVYYADSPVIKIINSQANVGG